MVLSFTILGEAASKSNSRRLVLFGNRPASIKSKKALAYVEAFRRQCPRPTRLLEGDLVMTAKIFYASRRPDLDESLIMDAMQKWIYANDRQIKEKHISWGLDPKRPRAEITIAPFQAELLA